MGRRYALKQNLTFGFLQRIGKLADLLNHYALPALGQNLAWITHYLQMSLEYGAVKPSVSAAKSEKN